MMIKRIESFSPVVCILSNFLVLKNITFPQFSCTRLPTPRAKKAENPPLQISMIYQGGRRLNRKGSNSNRKGNANGNIL